jgi:hypothetical protein
MQPANTRAAKVRRSNGRIDQLIAALDQQQIGDGVGAWVAEVLGVHSDGRDLWVQVARAHEPGQSLILRMSIHATAQHAIAALMKMEPFHGSLPHVIDVMQPAE